VQSTSSPIRSSVSVRSDGPVPLATRVSEVFFTFTLHLFMFVQFVLLAYLKFK